MANSYNIKLFEVGEISDLTLDQYKVLVALANSTNEQQSQPTKYQEEDRGNKRTTFRLINKIEEE